MKLKKFLALFLAGVTAAGCLVGCGQQSVGNQETNTSTSKVEESSSEVSSTVTEEPSLFNEPGVLPIVNEPVTLKVLTQDQPSNEAIDGKIANSLLWEFLEEKTGVHFEVEAYSAEELKNKLPLIMATPDDMPDLFWRCDFTAADIASYGQNGQILMLDELLEEYAPNIQECFDTLEGAYGAAVAADGHIYSLPSYNGSATNQHGGAMNKQYLENVGKDVPATFEELYDVFKAIKAHGDANGDGVKNNEFCWSGIMSTFRRGAMVMAGLNCYWPWQGCTFDAVDDEVFFVPTSERYRELLTWLNIFWEEGMIDPEIFTQTGQELDAKKAENRCFFMNFVQDPENANWSGVEGDFWPEPIVLHEGDEPLVTLGASYQTDIGAVSAYTEYPEICVMIMDYLFTEEGSMTAYFGQEGIDYEVVTKEPLVLKTLLGNGLGTTYGKTPVLVPRWVRDEWVQPGRTQLDRDKNGIAAEYGKFAFQNYLKFTDEETESSNVISADLGLFCDDYFVGFINGTYDIEKDWDKYVAECESMKANELTAIYQAAYNRYYGIE